MLNDFYKRIPWIDIWLYCLVFSSDFLVIYLAFDWMQWDRAAYGFIYFDSDNWHDMQW